MNERPQFATFRRRREKGDLFGNAPVAPAKSARYKPPDCPVDAIVDQYHTFMPTGRRVLRMNDARRKMIRARWVEFATEKRWPGAEAGLLFFKAYLEYCARSKFLTGRGQQRPDRMPFQVSIDYLFGPQNMVKIIEGAFHDAK